jgi:hypothetical protein
MLLFTIAALILLLTAIAAPLFLIALAVTRKRHSTRIDRTEERGVVTTTHVPLPPREPLTTRP